MTLQHAVYIVRSQGDRGDIFREVPVRDVVVEDEPNRGKDLSGDGDPDLHLAFLSDHYLLVAEAVEEASLRFGGRPGAFDECLAEVLVAVGDFPVQDLACALLVARSESAPRHQVGRIFKR